jgi:chromosome segregation ATPase
MQYYKTMNIKAIFFLGFISLLAFSGTKPALAVANSNTLNVPENMQELKRKPPLTEDQASKKCETLTSKIQQRLGMYTKNKAKHLERYSGVEKRLTAMVAKLETRGMDVAKLKTDLATFKEKTAKLETTYADYISLLSSTEQYACGQSQGQFITQLNQARTQLQAVHTQAQELRHFFQNTLRPDIQALRAQIQTEKEKN